MPARRMLWASIALFPLLAACGGSGSGGGSSFVSKADAACRTRGEAVAAASQSVATTASDAALYAGKIGSAFRNEVNTLRQLKPSANAKSSFDAFLTDERSIVHLAGAAQNAARANNAQTYGADAKAVLITQQRGLSKAAAAGLPICAQKLPASEQQPIKALAIASSVHPKASMCTSSVTKNYLAIIWQGSVSKCEHGIVKSPATSATVTQLFGIVPGAWVYVTQSGVPAPERKALLFFVKQNGTWKINSIQPQP